MDLHASLTDHRRYRRQLDKLHQKYLSTRYLYELEQDEVSLASMTLNQATVAKLIAKTVGRGEYRLQPARIRTITANGKTRLVFAYRLTDLLIHGVVSEIVEEAMTPALSPRLCSYRKGLSWWKPIADFAAYVRDHGTRGCDPRARGLYVLRRDIESYTDTIPVGKASPVWRMLRTVLFPSDSPEACSPADWRLLETVIRPEAFVTEDALFTQYRGVPTGQPISCVLFNLYLTELDRALDRVPGAFYTRYCDDILFAHPDPAVVEGADARLRACLAPLQLTLNEQKSRTLYLTVAGRQSADWLGSRGTTFVPFLGCRISAQGTVSLSHEKRRRLLADLQARALRTAWACTRAMRSRTATGRTVCAVINRALDSRIAFSQQRSAVLLRKAVTDRTDLKQLDYWIARIVLRAVTGERSPRAFRAVPYRTIREDWRLMSLLQARNLWPGK
jgi:hypothetical protein